MFIQVWGSDTRDQRAIEHVIRLFFEDPKVLFAEAQEAAGEKPSLRIYIHQSDEEECMAEVRLVRTEDDKVWLSKQVRVWSGMEDAEARRRFVKQTMLQPLLHTLQDYTGIHQPWGILTGIRPTKLMHHKAKQGLDPAAIRMEIKEETLISDEKIELMEHIVHRQLQAVPDLYSLREEVSLYIGIPFCPTKCAYCTFPAYAIGGKQGSVDAFLAGLHYELRQVGRWLREHEVRVTTVYFGGGTPTSITAEEMDRLYEEMYATLPHPDQIREVTVEAGRPDTITPEKLNVLRKWNIDRISINPQSYTQDTLQAIGRHHTVEETIDKYWLAREMGMCNINMDLIIGLPGEGMDHFEHTLDQTGKLLPESLTVHTLSYKRASEMTQNREKYKVAGRTEVGAMMHLATEWTKDHGYEPYYLYRQKNILGNLENVGYALPGRESIYNIMIMEEMQTIVGIGCGASSKWIDPETGDITRTANPKEPKAYNESFQRCAEEKLEWLSKLYGVEKKFESVY